jgi:1-phosphatidylinositol-4-phosphate 5-kinase
MSDLADYKLDVFDTYNFLVISPFAFITSTILIFAQLTNPKLLKQPGDLIFMVSISEFFLSAHYFVSALRTTYITSAYKEQSPFCSFNSYINNIFTVMEYAYNLSLMCHIFFTLKSAIQKSFVPKKLYHFVSFMSMIGVNYFYVSRNKLGKSPYGLCGVKLGELEGGTTKNVFRDIWLGSISVLGGVSLGFFVLVYTSRNLPNFGRELTDLKRDFMNYYKSYIQACILIWIVIFGSHLAQVLGQNQSMYLEENQTWRGAFFDVGRVGNTAKVLMPLLLFFIRIQDPLIRKNIWTPFSNIKNKIFGKKPRKNSVNSDAGTELGASTRKSSTEIEARRSSVTTMSRGRNTTGGLTEAFDLADITDNDTDDLMWMELLPTKIKESYTRTFLACIQNYYPERLNQKKDALSKNTGDTHDVIVYDIKGTAFMKNLNTDRSIIDCKFTIYNAAVFSEVIKAHFNPINIREAMDISKNEERIRKAGESGGGASGELFMFSHDGRLILKTATESEVEIFLKIMVDYKEHLRVNKRSQISKIIGLFDFIFDGSDKSIKLILMENLFVLNSDAMLRKYDMKGSKHSRKVLKSYNDLPADKRVDKILKDLDFLELDKDIDISDEQRKEIVASIGRDVDFFTRHQIIDYSIILAVVGLD